MKAQIKQDAQTILADYDPGDPGKTAVLLRTLWLSFAPISINAIKAEQREQQETVGIPVPVLKQIGKEIAKPANKQVDDYLPLTRLLWDEYGREGRVVTLVPLGKMELKAPQTIVPLLKEMCTTCITWEDADRLAMDAFEPIVRKEPETWLPEAENWLNHENKWVKRAGITVIGRLPLKHPTYTKRCITNTEQLLFDEDTDVKKATSFAIRLCARGEIAPVRDFLAQHVPPANAAATWVLCDAIRSMATQLLPQFAELLPHYEQWLSDPNLSSKDQRSVESAVKKLKQAS